jgi:hypothetical protein
LEETQRQRVRIVEFSQETISNIAETIGADISLAPFQLPGAAVHQMIVNGADGRPVTMVTLWPSLHRVDAIGSSTAVVFTRIASVQLVEDAEILFRRQSGEYLVIARNGKIVVRA